MIKVLTNAAAEHEIITYTALGFVPASTQYITAYRHVTPKFDEITNAVLAKGPRSPTRRGRSSSTPRS